MTFSLFSTQPSFSSQIFFLFNFVGLIINFYSPCFIRLGFISMLLSTLSFEPAAYSPARFLGLFFISRFPPSPSLLFFKLKAYNILLRYLILSSPLSPPPFPLLLILGHVTMRAPNFRPIIDQASLTLSFLSLSPLITLNSPVPLFTAPCVLRSNICF